MVWNNHSFELIEEQAEDRGPDASGIALDPFVKGIHLLVGQRSDVGVTRVGQTNEDSIFTLTVAGLYASALAP